MAPRDLRPRRLTARWAPSASAGCQAGACVRGLRGSADAEHVAVGGVGDDAFESGYPWRNVDVLDGAAADWPALLDYFKEFYGPEAFDLDDDVVYYRLQPSWMTVYAPDVGALLAAPGT
ncbi:MAG: hypothetical protein ACK5OX_02205 [Desertimonas sp.]